MKKHVSALAGAVLLLTTAACGTAAGAAQTGPPPALTAEQAAGVQAAYDKGNNENNKAHDVSGLSRIEASPLLTLSQAAMKIDQAREQPPIPPIFHDGATFLIPAAGRYPRWFVSVATSIRGGVPSARPSYTVFTQRAEGAPWKAAYDVAPLDTVPAVRTNPAGAAAVVTDPATLVLKPAALDEAIFTHYTDRTQTDKFGRTAALDDRLGAGYDTGVETLAGRGSTLTRTLEESAQPSYVLATTDGGALAFTASIVTDTLTPADGNGTVELQADTNEAALAGEPDGLTARQISIRRLQTFLTYIPTWVSGKKIRVLAYTDMPIKVSTDGDVRAVG